MSAASSSAGASDRRECAAANPYDRAAAMWVAKRVLYPPELKKRKLRERQMRDALALTLRALEHHPFWCGYNPDAPGDGIYNAAVRAAKEALGVRD